MTHPRTSNGAKAGTVYLDHAATTPMYPEAVARVPGREEVGAQAACRRLESGGELLAAPGESVQVDERRRGHRGSTG